MARRLLPLTSLRHLSVAASRRLLSSALPVAPRPYPPLTARFAVVRCLCNRPGDSAYSPLNTGKPTSILSSITERPPTDMAPLFPGCDYHHWLVVIHKPGGEGATKQQMIDCYVQTLAKVLGRKLGSWHVSLPPICYLKLKPLKWVLGKIETACDNVGFLMLVFSEEEAKKKIYNVSCERYFAFGCDIDEETSNKLEGLPGVLFVLPDSYVDPEHKDYGGELFVNGEIVQRPPERQRRVEPQPQRQQDRPRYNDRTRYVRRRENTK
ncbi:Cyanate hydratase isoform D [Glycine soja]|uniref:Cyanate hydratase isoform D n=1 Tax=Glycine soja TaxID=3848 RepID=A0A445IG07_GLYSO|nr:Cyanate hydratase isoform D [Glycine soja]